MIVSKVSAANSAFERDWPISVLFLAVPGMRESIKAGMAEPLPKSSEELEW